MTDSGWGALAGLRVLDLTQALAGPFGTQLLADHGAEVVKVEPMVSGDIARLTGPFLPGDTEHKDSGYFHSINRNKKSIVIDLKTSEGREILLRLVPKFDVVVENFRAHVMDKLGLSYETLHAANPRLVYATLRGFGDPRSGKSPYAEWPAYDVVAQAMGGISGVTGPDADHPTKIGPGIGDTVPGLYLAFGILAAVMKARETGRGQHVDVSMVDAVLAVSERIVHQYYFGKMIAKPQGNHQPTISPFGLFPARDGHVAIGAPHNAFFKILCERLDAPELFENPDYATFEARATNRLQLREEVGAVTRRFTKAELMERLGGIVPFGPVYDMGDIAADPHFAVRDMLPEIEIPGQPDEIRVAGVPVKLSETPGGVHARGPRQGEHSDEVLAAADVSAEEIKRWRAANIIA